ncbi:MAG: hypothetical protein ABWY18_05355 [Tardiphaga sp.]
MSDLINVFTERGDLAHLALFLWASMASAAALFALRELAGASRRFDEFIRQLALFNRRNARQWRRDDDARGEGGERERDQ